MVEKLRQLKKKSNMTNQQIAEKSNIPESTVARIFSGKTPNPTVTTVISMARAMGGSAADLLNEEDGAAAGSLTKQPKFDGADNGGENAADETANRSSAGGSSFGRGTQTLEDITSHEKIYEDMIHLYKDEIRKKDVWIARLFWCAAGIVAFILFILVFDILHPNFGFVKY